MSRTIEFYTPEQVAIQYELAGVGSRAMAAIVDATLEFFLYALLWVIPAVLIDLQILPPLNEWNGTRAGMIAIAALIFAYYALLWSYYVFFETLWNGETPGKRWMGLRVIKDGGYPVDFRSVVIRNLIRALDTLPILYGLGMFMVTYHQRYQRLGDMAAGTLVVRHSREERSRFANPGNAQVLRLLDTSVLSQMSRLTREEYRMVQRFLERRNDLPIGLRGEFTERLAKQLIEKFGYQEPALGMDYQRWLEELDLAFRRRALGITAPEPAPAPVAKVPPPATAPDVEPVSTPAPEARRW